MYARHSSSGTTDSLHSQNVKTMRNEDDKWALKCTQLVSLHGCLLCTEHHVSFHHGQTNHKGHTYIVYGLSRRASTSTKRARRAFTSTRKIMFQFCLFFLLIVLPLHRASVFSSHGHALNKRHTHTIHHSSSRSPTIASLLSLSPSYCTTNVKMFPRAFWSSHYHPHCHRRQLNSQQRFSEE